MGAGRTLAASAAFALGALLLFKAMLQISHASHPQPMYRTVTGLAGSPSPEHGLLGTSAALSCLCTSWLVLHRLVCETGGKQVSCSLFPPFVPAQEELQSLSFISNAYLALDI